MKVAAFLMLLAFTIPMRSSGQDLFSTLSLAAEGGYLGNTYLHPMLPIWATADAAFIGLEPSARFAWVGDRTYAAVEGRLRLIERMNPVELWSVAASQARLDRRLSRNIAIGADGSVSRIRFQNDQWLAWGGPYLRARVRPYISLTARIGASFRSYDGADGLRSFNQTNAFTVVQINASTPGPWTLSGHAYASRPIAEGARAAGSGASISYRVNSDLSIGTETVIERFEGDAAAWRGAVTAEWQVGEAVSWSARLGNQQFWSGDASSSDAFASVGLTYRWRHRADLSPPPPLRWTEQGDEVELRFEYEGAGELFLVGDFNDWTVGGTALRRHSDGVYSARLSLEAGKYEYKIMVVENGEQRWLPLPDDVLTTDDDFGDTNGILLVE